MDIEPFESYFDKTIWKGADNVPSYQQLKDMENACMSKLYELKNQDYQQYQVLYTKYGEKAVSRITFCNRKIAEKISVEEESKVKRLLSSYNRFLKNLKAIDRRKYENTLRNSIQKGKAASRTLIKPKEEDITPPIERVSVQVPHFTNLKIDADKAAILYDRLVQDRVLEDTGKDGFIYYYTGTGKQAKQKLKWWGDDILLSVLMEQLSPKGGRISWQVLGKIYEGLNTDSMKNVLSKTKKGEVVYTYEAHKKTVEEWLK